MSTWGGWNCSVCGAWVPNGTIHSCGGSPTYHTQPSDSTTLAMGLGRIEALLEQILVRLIRLEEERQT